MNKLIKQRKKKLKEEIKIAKTQLSNNAIGFSPMIYMKPDLNTVSSLLKKIF